MEPVLPPGAVEEEEKPTPPPAPEPEPEPETDASEEEAAPEEAPTPGRRRRGRSRRKKPVERQPVEAKEPESVPIRDARSMDYETWIQQWDWASGMYSMKVKRVAPAARGGVSIAGYLPGGERDGDWIRERELEQMFGGGTYDCQVIGPSKKDGKRRMVNHRNVKISGEPRMTMGGVPSKLLEDETKIQSLPPDFFEMEEEYTPRRRRRRSSRSRRRRPPVDPYEGVPGMPPDAPPQQDQTLSILKENIDWMRAEVNKPVKPDDSLEKIQQMRETYDAVADRREQGAQQMLTEKDRLVAEQKALADHRVEEARERERKAEEKAQMALEATQEKIAEANTEMRRLQEEKEHLRTETAKVQTEMTDKMNERVHEVKQSSDELLIALLTNAQTTSAQQINTTVQAYDQRLATSEASHQTALQNLQQSYENRIKALETFFQSQIETAKQMAIAREQQLTAETTGLRGENKRLSERLDDARDRLMQEIQRVAKTADPLEQLGKMEGILGSLGGIREALGGGGGAGGGEIGEGLDNPALAMFGALGDKLLSVVPHVTEAITAVKNAPQPGMAPQLPPAQPPQQRPHPQQRPPQQAPRPQGPPPQGMAGPPQRPPQPRLPPRRPPQPQVKIDKGELQKAIFFINNVLQRAPVSPPEELAKGAISVVDNAVLVELAKRRPDKVIAELDGAGILTGAAASPEGREYVSALLVELRKLLITKSVPVAQDPVPDPVPDQGEEN